MGTQVFTWAKIYTVVFSVKAPCIMVDVRKHFRAIFLYHHFFYFKI
jgi:hypothetical protein